MQDCGEESMYLYYDKEKDANGELLYPLPVLLIVYTDEIAVSGERVPTDRLFARVCEIMGITEDENADLLYFIGLERFAGNDVRHAYSESRTDTDD